MEPTQKIMRNPKIPSKLSQNHKKNKKKRGNLKILKNHNFAKNPQKIKDLIERRVIDHDHVADSKKSKYGSEFKLKVISLDELPEFIKLNWKKYEQFLDLRP